MHFPHVVRTIIAASLISYTASAQITIPKISFDSTAVTRNEKGITRKVYYKNKAIVLQVNYPDYVNDNIQGYCYKSNIVYDSIYIYPGANTVVVAYSANGFFAETWTHGSNVVKTESHYADGKLKSKYSQVAGFSAADPRPICSFLFSYVGEFAEYTKEGKPETIRNFDTGEQKAGAPISGLPKLQALKKIADNIVSASLGKKICTSFIVHDFARTIYHPVLKNGDDPKMPSRDGYLSWFSHENEALAYIDFAYDFKFSEREYFFTIVIRLDKNGKMISQKLEQTYMEDTNTTIGLVNKPLSNLITKDEAIKLAGATGAGEQILVDFIWKAEPVGSSYGKYYYRVLYDELQRQERHYFRERLVNAETKEVSAEGEYADGGEVVMEQELIDRMQVDNKYGFEKRSTGEFVVPAEYDELPFDLDDLMIARKGGYAGLITDQNEVVIPFKFDRVAHLYTGNSKRHGGEFFVVTSGQLNGLNTYQGKEILPVVYSNIEYDDSEQIKAYQGDKVVVVYDLKSGVLTMH